MCCNGRDIAEGSTGDGSEPIGLRGVTIVVFSALSWSCLCDGVARQSAGGVSSGGLGGEINLALVTLPLSGSLVADVMEPLTLEALSNMGARLGV